jgi:GNAT superfamily N-acetyltransferase
MINYRIAQTGDEESIHRLIVELAVFEREPNAVIVPSDALYNHLFVEKVCFAIVAVDVQTDTVIGFALYYFSYSTWKGKCLYLEDIYVQEIHRKLGIGQVLFDMVVCVAKEKKVARMDWQVLNWNNAAINFYKKNNADLSDEWLNGRYFF